MSSDTGLMGQFPAEGGMSGGGDAFNVAIYLIVSMAILCGISYLIGKITSNRRFEDWAKNEFLQVLVSAALVGGLYLLMAPGTGMIILLFNSLIPGEDVQIPVLIGSTLEMREVSADGCIAMSTGTVLCYAYSYLSALSGQMASLLFSLLMSATLLDIISKIGIDIIVVEITPFSGLSSIVQVLNTMIQHLFFLNMTVNVEMTLLQFIDKTALTIFLPIGVVLRSFFATRRIGGALIALAVGLYVVFPLTIALNAISVDQVADESFNDLAAAFSAIGDHNPIEEFSGVSDLLSPEAWTSVLTSYKEAASALVDAVMEIPNLVSTMISLLVVQIVVLPILSIMLTLIATKELAGVFGSEVNLSRFEV